MVITTLIIKEITKDELEEKKDADLNKLNSQKKEPMALFS